MDLPFTPTPKSLASQLRYIEMAVSNAIGELANEFDVEDFGVWTAAENGAPRLFISGLLGLKEGSLSRKKMNEKERRLCTGFRPLPGHLSGPLDAGRPLLSYRRADCNCVFDLMWSTLDSNLSPAATPCLIFPPACRDR